MRELQPAELARVSGGATSLSQVAEFFKRLPVYFSVLWSTISGTYQG